MKRCHQPILEDSMTKHFPSTDALPGLTSPDDVRPSVRAFKAYVPGLSIDEIRQRYGLDHVVKMASNENPLGTSPLVQERLRHRADVAFRYPQGGNPRLVTALAQRHGVDPKRVVVGNGSDEIIDLLMRVRATPGVHNIACFSPCFSIYTVQARLCGVELRQAPLNKDFSFPLDALRSLVDDNTALVFLTTPDNPSGYCPDAATVRDFAHSLPKGCLLVVDEAYMDFVDDEAARSLLASGAGLDLPNVVFLRTFSKSFGLAGLRLGYAVLSTAMADYLWRVRLPFSVNILAEEAGLAALEDTVFYEKTLRVVREGRQQLTQGLAALGCTVWPSQANFLMFSPPSGTEAATLFDQLLGKGYIIRPLKSYDLPHLLRVSVGSPEENAGFLQTCREILA